MYCPFKWTVGCLGLNCQTSEWREIISGVQQGSVLQPLLFLIYINDLPYGISLCKIFADDKFLFSKVHNLNKSVNKLNADLEKIGQLAYRWKMQFNPDSNKQEKLFFLINLIQQTFSICLLIIIALLNVLVKNT